MKTIMKMKFAINGITIIDEIMEDTPETTKLFNETLILLQKEVKNFLHSELTMIKVKSIVDVEPKIRTVIKGLRKK